MLHKVLKDLDVTPYSDYYESIKENLKWSEYPNGKQLGLQYRCDQNPWTDAVGRAKLSDDWNKNVLTNPFFADTIFEEFIKEYNLTRTRLMWVKPYSCYSMHKDDSTRIHLPLITNPKCFFVFKEEGLLHMEPGKVYWVDTTKEHTFINCSMEWRLHLVGATNEM